MARYSELLDPATPPRARTAAYAVGLTAIVLIVACAAPGCPISRAYGAVRGWGARHVGGEPHQHARSSGGAGDAPADKVLLELFVMAKCPDASYCEHFLAEDVERLRDIVHVRTEYIAQEGDGGALTCKHGPDECAADAIQLCVQAHTPAARNYDWFYRFLLCTWDSGLPAASDELAGTCMDEAGVDSNTRAAIFKCIGGAEGQELLLASAREVARRRVVNSCTVEVEGAWRCVRDGDEWRDCPGGRRRRDFVRSICKAYRRKTGLRSEACRQEEEDGEGEGEGEAAASQGRRQPEGSARQQAPRRAAAGWPAT